MFAKLVRVFLPNQELKGLAFSFQPCNLYPRLFVSEPIPVTK